MSECKCRPGMNEVCDICQKVVGKVLLDKPTAGVTVIVVENWDESRAIDLLRSSGIACYVMQNYFDIEGFTTLEEVEAWLEDK